MRCPSCGCLDDKVIETRISKEGDSIRRRRVCTGCESRYTTYEMIVRAEAAIVKRDGRREDFNPDKLRAGIATACGKRPVGEEQIDNIVKRIADAIARASEREIPSHKLGEMVMDELRKIDEVAYVRFASVYRRFKDIDQFIDEIRQMTDTPTV